MPKDTLTTGSDLEVYESGKFRSANELEIAAYAARESALHQALTRHLEGCPAKRLEVSQERGPLKVVRCIDCGEQTTVMAQ